MNYLEYKVWFCSQPEYYKFAIINYIDELDSENYLLLGSSSTMPIGINSIKHYTTIYNIYLKSFIADYTSINDNVVLKTIYNSKCKINSSVTSTINENAYLISQSTYKAEFNKSSKIYFLKLTENVILKGEHLALVKNYNFDTFAINTSAYLPTIIMQYNLLDSINLEINSNIQNINNVNAEIVLISNKNTLSSFNNNNINNLKNETLFSLSYE